jgi:hypothetical protein
MFNCYFEEITEEEEKRREEKYDQEETDVGHWVYQFSIYPRIFFFSKGWPTPKLGNGSVSFLPSRTSQIERAHGGKKQSNKTRRFYLARL